MGLLQFLVIRLHLSRVLHCYNCNVLGTSNSYSIEKVATQHLAKVSSSHNCNKLGLVGGSLHLLLLSTHEMVGTSNSYSIEKVATQHLAKVSSSHNCNKLGLVGGSLPLPVPGTVIGHS